MEEMVYKKDRLRPPKTLDSGSYLGYNFYILNLGTHPCAYVEIPENDLLFGLDYNKIYDKYNIECHGGLTYSQNKLITVDNIGWFIGWDYAHYGDYAGYDDFLDPEDKKWSTQEIKYEVEDVIDRIVKINL